MSRLKLNWSYYKLDPDERSVWFGDFILYVVHDRQRGRRDDSKQWIVTWYDGNKRIPRSTMPGLTDRKFTSLRAGQIAAERYFLPFLKIVPHIVKVDVKVRVWPDGYNPAQVNDTTGGA